MPEDDARQELARRIIELSDRISDHGRKISEPGFVPTSEYFEESRRLAETCRLLIEEAHQAHGDGV